MIVPSLERLKREDFRRTKHDAAFSSWKILIGDSDWEDHKTGKEGAEKYRTQNLPNWISCPGVYELGVAVSRPRYERRSRKLDSSSVVPVYLGQADNLRNRLQQYGRDGAHLENGCSNDKFVVFSGGSSHKGPGLFTGIFSRGLPIVYRCAPVKSKKDAKISEKQLLDKFDYAWNKGSNGARRQDDIYKKLDHLARASQFSLLAKKLLFFHPRQVGIKIKACEPHRSKSGSDMDESVTLSRIFGIRRLHTRQEQNGCGYHSTDICGVAIGQGAVCTTTPVKGRKRCAMHKGMRVVSGHVSNSKEPSTASVGSEDANARELPTNEYFVPVCGVILGDGSPCKRKPFQRNKRCLEHKGMRIAKSQPKFVGKEINQNQ